MKIVAITDKKGSAIDRLARMNEERLPHLRYVVCPLHPKRPSDEEIGRLKVELLDADMVDCQYWKSGMKARMLELGLGIPWVLTHHNEHNIHDTQKDHWNWKDVVWPAHVAKNGWQRGELKKLGIDATLIPHAIDFDNFSYADKLPERKEGLKPCVGYVGQIKKVKGVREIAQACKELGYYLLLTGSVSEAEYFKDLMDKYTGTIKWALPAGTVVPDEMLGKVYHEMHAYCANSDDGTESGTMPILEAMASGVPVVTRRIGLVRDCGQHQKNMWIREGRYDDVEDLKAALKMVVENQDIANELRENAWRTVRQYHPDRQSREYEKVFRHTMHKGQATVSVIMPTCGRNTQVLENILKLTAQSYKNFEVVVCDDNTREGHFELAEMIKELRPHVHFPIKHVWTGKRDDTYGLAKARNIGVIEATGDILVFCDDRLVMHPGAVNAFVQELSKAAGNKERKLWVWGSKDGKFKTFVENFSATWRRQLIDAGMFNERINCYGGMTQELSGRFGSQGFRFLYVPQALAEPSFGTHSRSQRRDEIIRSKVRLYKMGFQ